MTRLRLALAIVAVGTIALPPAESLGAGSETVRRAHDLQLTVDSRWAGGADGGYYPIRIRLVNLARPRVLEFVFAGSGGSDARAPTVTRKIQVDQNATQQFSLSVPLVSRGSQGQLRIIENGRELDQLSQHVTLPDAKQDWFDRPSLLVISPSPAAVDCSKFEEAVLSLVTGGGTGRTGAGMYLSSPSMRSNDFQAVGTQLLPESWIDYTALDIVAIPLAALEKMTAAARTALVEWTLVGGTLIVFEVGRPARESADLARLLELGNRAPQAQVWRPADPALHRPVKVAADAESVLTVSSMRTQEMTQEADESGGEGQANATVIANTPRWPVAPEAFSRLDLMAGRVFAFPENPFPGSPIDWAWWIHSANLQQITWANRNGLSARERHPQFYRFLIPGVGAVPMLAFVSLITIFAIVIGPVNYFVVRRRKQLYLLVLTIPVIAFVTSCALFGYAIIADGFGVQSRLRSFTMLDQNSKTAVSFNRISLYAGIVPSAGLTFSPDTAVFPIWPDESCLESGNVDWTNAQHLARGWLRSRTPAQFETIAVRAERSRVEINSAGSGEVEAANGLEWEIDRLLVKDEAGRLFSARKIPAGGAMKLAAAGAEDLAAFSASLSADELLPPPGTESFAPSPVPMMSGGRRALRYWAGRESEPDSNFAGSRLETYLKIVARPVESPNSGGLPPRTYVAVFSQNPGIELGIERTRAAAGLYVLMGSY